MGRVLVITNDFPPRRGGIESFVFSLCAGLPAEQVVVYTARMDGSEAIDSSVGYPVIRDRTRMLLPTWRVGRSVRAVVRRYGCDRVVFGAAAPLGLLARGLRADGVRRIVGLTHGHEVWWAKVPVARWVLRRIGDDVDVLTYVSEFCRGEIAKALSVEAAEKMVRLSPGVDTDRFRPGLDGSGLRARLGITADQPVVLAASRLVARKGHDTLITAWPGVLESRANAVLLIVGDGPYRRRLHGLTAKLDLEQSLRFVPSVPWEQMPLVYAAADVFAMPCRTRLWGLEPEALGIVFLEAAASGLPVIVGDSGGAPETVVDGCTGHVVDPQNRLELAKRIVCVLGAEETYVQAGECGRLRVGRQWRPEAAVRALRELLERR